MSKNIFKMIVLAVMTVFLVVTIPVSAQKKLLSVSYPPNNYQTKVNKIFFVGKAPLPGQVTINGLSIDRSPAGDFMPTLPLQDGANDFSIRYQNEEIKLKVIKEPNVALAPISNGQAETWEAKSKSSPLPADIGCLGTPSDSRSTKNSGTEVMHYSTGQEPQAIYGAGQYLGCAVARATGTVNSAVGYRAETQRSATIQPISYSPATSTTISNNLPTPSAGNMEVAEVIADDTIARTGPSSDFGRVTPLLKGIKATVVARQDGNDNGKQATFVKLDYGAWVKAADLKVTSGVTTAPKSIIHNVRSQNRGNNTEVLFPLQVQVPLVIDQTESTLKLTLYNTTPQDLKERLELGRNSMVDRVTWRSVAPSQVEYTFTFKSRQQWGYKYRYEGNNLVLTLRHPPRLDKQSARPLTGAKILIDPGHGGTDSGAVGTNGYAEKEATLFASKLLANELVAKGATVYLTRESDKSVELHERRAIVEKLEPTLSVSIHYNSLPEGGNPNTIKGFSTYWYHAQAQGLAGFLHTYVTQFGSRPQHGVIWDNLALARPSAAPSVLLELGFMSNPDELQWISDPQAQQQLVKTLASGITQWLMTVN